MAEAEAVERRGSDRFNLFWTGVATKADGGAFKIRTDRISVDGGVFNSPQPLRNGEVLLITFRIMVNGTAIGQKVVVKVIHTRILRDGLGYGVGFSFFRPSSKLIMLIERLSRRKAA
ncbi:MAG: PilZ domain-containing protein [Motiliproteus sp.]